MYLVFEVNDMYSKYRSLKMKIGYNLTFKITETQHKTESKL